MNCLIIDDEPLAIELLENFVSKVSFLEVEQTFRNPIEAFEYLQRTAVDLVFLDIQMPDLSGLEIAESLESRTKFIFTTAFREYAADSYDLNAVDYLVKPFSFSRFLKAVHKVQVLDKEEDLAKAPDKKPLQIKAEGKTYRLDLSKITYVESFKDYIKIHTQAKILVSYTPISHIEKELPAHDFLRIHRAFIVSVERVKSFSTTAVQIGDEELPIGRTFKTKAIKVLKALN